AAELAEDGRLGLRPQAGVTQSLVAGGVAEKIAAATGAGSCPGGEEIGQQGLTLVVENEGRRLGGEFVEALLKMTEQRPRAVGIAIVQHAAVEAMLVHVIGEAQPEFATQDESLPDAR